MVAPAASNSAPVAENLFIPMTDASDRIKDSVTEAITYLNKNSDVVFRQIWLARAVGLAAFTASAFLVREPFRILGPAVSQLRSTLHSSPQFSALSRQLLPIIRTTYIPLALAAVAITVAIVCWNRLSYINAICARKIKYRAIKNEYDALNIRPRSSKVIPVETRQNVDTFINLINKTIQIKLAEAGLTEKLDTLVDLRTATSKDLKKQYRRISLICHPDKTRLLVEAAQNAARQAFEIAKIIKDETHLLPLRKVLAMNFSAIPLKAMRIPDSEILQLMLALNALADPLDQSPPEKIGISYA
jgi:hypothetical protein